MRGNCWKPLSRVALRFARLSKYGAARSAFLHWPAKKWCVVLTYIRGLLSAGLISTTNSLVTINDGSTNCFWIKVLSGTVCLWLAAAPK
jgi:hypothetical protein